MSCTASLALVALSSAILMRNDEAKEISTPQHANYIKLTYVTARRTNITSHTTRGTPKGGRTERWFREYGRVLSASSRNDGAGGGRGGTGHESHEETQ